MANNTTHKFLNKLKRIEKAKKNKSHREVIDDLEDPEIDDAQESEQIVETPTTQPKSNPLQLIRTWYYSTFEKFGHYPNDQTLKQAWLEVTKQSLTDEGLNLLRETIEKKGEQIMFIHGDNVLTKV